MNIFYIERDPRDCAMSMYDKHVVKMILETAQILSTAHRVLDGVQYIELSENRRKIKRWKLEDEKYENALYKATHVNHPSCVWARASNNNYTWLFCHFDALLDEYHYRYDKHHKCKELVQYLRYPPKNIMIGYLQQPPAAMPQEYIVENDVLSSYRKYYKEGKSHLISYKKREVPEWLGD
jgi:hypothetical protein